LPGQKLSISVISNDIQERKKKLFQNFNISRFSPRALAHFMKLIDRTKMRHEKCSLTIVEARKREEEGKRPRRDVEALVSKEPVLSQKKNRNSSQDNHDLHGVEAEAMGVSEVSCCYRAFVACFLFWAVLASRGWRENIDRLSHGQQTKACKRDEQLELGWRGKCNTLKSTSKLTIHVTNSSLVLATLIAIHQDLALG
jgi:hypothetical protein